MPRARMPKNSRKSATMIKSEVYERLGTGDMTRSAFYFVMGAVLTWGFVATHIVSTMTAAWQPGIVMFLIVGLGLTLLGIFLSRSGSAFVSFIGFNLVVVPFGAILGPVLAVEELSPPGIVAQASATTAMVTGVMAMSGLMFPDFYRSIGGALAGALMALLVVLVVSLFVPALVEFKVIHFAAAGLFGLYLGFGMIRASSSAATIDNAVNVSISLYLDAINLLLWILRISNKK